MVLEVCNKRMESLEAIFYFHHGFGHRLVGALQSDVGGAADDDSFVDVADGVGDSQNRREIVATRG